MIPIKNRQPLWRETFLGEVLLENTPASVGMARSKALAIVGEQHPLKDDVLLIVSELVTNAVVHADKAAAGDTISLRLASTKDLLIVEVYDPGSLSDAPRIKEDPDASDEGGRGLYLVSLICGGRWATRTLGKGLGRLVWAALPQTDHAPSACEVIIARRQKVA